MDQTTMNNMAQAISSMILFLFIAFSIIIINDIIENDNLRIIFTILLTILAGLGILLINY